MTPEETNKAVVTTPPEAVGVQEVTAEVEPVLSLNSESSVFNGKESFSFEYDFLGMQVGHQAITGIPFHSAFIDIGTPESYQEAIKMFSPS